MPKQLRLDVAQLTDVGRKREHNEDNMAHVIPKDPQVMARKGALFIVADGMGGHAAGEVASEIAVDAVTNVYYQDDSDDAAISLLHAIKRANASIHQRAAENMLRSGMGTTCIAAVLRGNMAYIANVGDSRAYIVRGGQVRQISQDHSWVAEQVRAGLLTEEQARTHAQRNVITRCLGTQADVDIDVFPEQLEENDALVLCSDGLSGYIADEDLLKTVEQAGPQESVYHLIEQANENGGPDNITAIVVRVLEVGWEPPAMRRPAFVGGREESEDTAVLGTLPGGAAAPMLTGDRGGAASGFPLRLASGPLSSPDSITAPQSAIETDQGRRRLFYPTLALLVLLVVVAVGSGAYFFFHTTNGGTSVDQSLQNAQTLITRANGEMLTNPTQALNDLASAQKNLHALPGNTLNSTQRQKVANLQSNLTTVVQSAITSYNQQSAITLLICSNTPTLNTGSNGVQQVQITTVQAPNAQPVLYALATDAQGKNGKVYQVNNNGLTTVTQLPLAPTTPQVIAMTGSEQQLLLLSASVSSSTKPTSYALSAYIPGQKKATSAVAVNAQSGFTPSLVTAAGTDVYVIVTSPTASSTTAFVMDYKLMQGKFTGKPTMETLTASNVVSVAAFPHQQLFFLLADGSIHSLQFTPGSGAFTSVFIPHAIPAPLATGAVSALIFNVQTPVPVASPTSEHGLQALSIGASTTSSLVASQIGTTTHLYVMDAYAHRLLDFTEDTATTSSFSQTTPTVSSGSAGTGGGTVGTATVTVPASNNNVTLNLAGQYISPALFTQLKSMTAAPDGSAWYVLAQNSSSLLDTITLQTKVGSQAVCAA
ncbi:MAG: Stp1/IreP family PP2C-type Ser/Thr phosphatase [Ktedonobacteraceae bacterium]